MGVIAGAGVGVDVLLEAEVLIISIQISIIRQVFVRLPEAPLYLMKNATVPCRGMPVNLSGFTGTAIPDF